MLIDLREKEDHEAAVKHMGAKLLGNVESSDGVVMDVNNVVVLEHCVIVMDFIRDSKNSKSKRS